jgi:serine/threonine protein kinase
MIYGEYPYIGHSDDDILIKIKEQRPNYSKVNISDNARDFIERCLTVDPDKRITWKEIYLHPILEESKIPFGLRSTLKI